MNQVFTATKPATQTVKPQRGRAPMPIDMSLLTSLYLSSGNASHAVNEYNAMRNKDQFPEVQYQTAYNRLKSEGIVESQSRARPLTPKVNVSRKIAGMIGLQPKGNAEVPSDPVLEITPNAEDAFLDLRKGMSRGFTALLRAAFEAGYKACQKDNDIRITMGDAPTVPTEPGCMSTITDTVVIPEVTVSVETAIAPTEASPELQQEVATSPTDAAAEEIEEEDDATEESDAIEGESLEEDEEESDEWDVVPGSVGSDLPEISVDEIVEPDVM